MSAGHDSPVLRLQLLVTPNFTAAAEAVGPVWDFLLANFVVDPPLLLFLYDPDAPPPALSLALSRSVELLEADCAEVLALYTGLPLYGDAW